MIERALKLAREFHRLSQTELANRLGISNSYLSEIESGVKTPTLELLNKYAEQFDIPASTLLALSEQLDGAKETESSRKKSDRILKFMEWVVDDENRTDSRGKRSGKAR